MQMAYGVKRRRDVAQASWCGGGTASGCLDRKVERSFLDPDLV